MFSKRCCLYDKLSSVFIYILKCVISKRRKEKKERRKGKKEGKEEKKEKKEGKTLLLSFQAPKPFK